ncbi:hypothetical protein SH139x_001295 [Planctomycetaceae bacterium SH139]
MKAEQEVKPPKKIDTDAAHKEKVLIHAAYPLWRKHLIVTMARAKELQENGNQVVVSYCNARGGTCAVNYTGNPLSCVICQARVRDAAQASGLPVVALDVTNAQTESTPALKLSELRQVVEGVNSGLISSFRTLPLECKKVPILDRIRRRYYATASGVLKSMKRLVESEQFEHVEVFNGRHACSKTAIIAAKSANLPFNTLEITAGGKKPIIHLGHVVHDRKAIQRRIASQPIDIQLATQFFAKRRLPSGNKFAKKHKLTFIAPPESENKRRVSIFLSSQDEFASLGRDWDSPFSDYAPIVEAACKANPEIFFCIRFHPNQADVAGDIVSPFDQVSELPNTKIYFPTDQVNSYELMDWSDTVVTFGSTITVEACWAKKPVIMLGPSYFDELDVSYNPSSLHEFIALLSHNLPPKNADNAARFAYYHCHDQNPLRYVETSGKRMEAKGFTLKYGLIGQLARSSDNIACRFIKTWAKRSLKSINKPA